MVMWQKQILLMVFMIAGTTTGCTTPYPPDHGSVVVVSGTTGDIAVYNCADGYHLIGHSTRLCLPSNQWEGSAPVCAETECGPLHPPLDGSVDVTMETASGQIVTYRCNEGFLLRGSSTRLCSNRTWEGSPPECLLVDCGYFTIPFADVNIDGTGYGSVAVVTCLPGYTLRGPGTVVCESDSMWSRKPVCDLTDCGYIGPPTNGFVSTPTGTGFGQAAIYSCQVGYRLVGNVKRYCTSQGWNSTMPYCTLIDCGTVPDLQFGSVVVSGTTYLHTAIYTCIEGYHLTEASQRTCGQDGRWSGVPPACVVIDCGTLPSPINGVVDTTPGTTYKKAAAYTCKTGYRLVGTNVRICDHHGNWTDEAPRCLLRDCGPLPHPINGLVNTTAGTTVGQLATYQCNPGFVLSGPRVRVCNDMGHWSGSQPSCVVEDCEPIPTPANGQTNMTGTRPGDVAVISCLPGYRLVGQARLVCLNSSQWSSEQPVCVLIDCGRPQEPVNGRVSLPEGTLMADIALYECNEGYRRVGPSARMCTETGRWSGQEPVCLLIDCGSPPAPVGGSVVVTGTAYGDRAIYLCERGYQVLGPSQLQCTDIGWSGTAPVCTIIDCGSIDTPENGFVALVSTLFESVVTFHCNPGFQLQGYDTAICTETGDWSQEPPRCGMTTCGPLPAPVGGRVDTSAGSIADYSCFDGYTLNGNPRRTCGNSGQWEGTPPTCEPVDCGGLSAPESGSVDLSVGTTFGKVALYSCEEGYYIDGTYLRECQANGSWSDMKPVCRQHDCGNSTAPVNGRIVNMTGTMYGDMIRFDCNAGYALIGAKTIVCQDNGYWSDVTPSCAVTNCGSLVSPGNGSVSTTEPSTFGQVAVYRCHNGYDLVGARTRICQENGTWSGTEPVCQVKDCGSLSAPMFGSVSTPWGTGYNGQAIYTCIIDGYQLIGSSVRLCQVNGTWSGEKPVCNIYDCGTPDTPENGVMSIPLGTKYGAVATYYCNQGYRLSGSDTRTCINDSWTGTQPQCNIRTCRRLSNPANGIVSALNLTYQSVAMYNCLPGYELEGRINRTCLENGSWSDTPPTCVPKDCGPRDPPINGKVLTPEGTTFSKISTYICDDGFLLVGIDISVCLGGGGWSLTPPTCRLHDCGAPPNPNNGQVDIPGNTTYGQIATYSCFPGYDLHGHGIVSCQGNGEWSGVATCTIKDCGYLHSVENGMVDISKGTTYTSIATYSCYTGYQLQGDETRLCQATGKWSGKQPTCDIKDCGGLAYPTNGGVSFPFGTTYGEAVIYTCNPGYLLVGNDTRVCEVTGKWSGEPAMCAIKDCGPLEPPALGSVDLTGTAYGMVATYRCVKNYEVRGVETRQCMSDGDWSAVPPSCELRGDLIPVEMTLTLNATVLDELSQPGVYTTYKDTVKDILMRFYQREMDGNIKETVILSMWKGSLNVKFELIISRTRRSAEQLGQSTALLSRSLLGQINNISISASTLTLGNSAVDLSSVEFDFLVCLGYTAARPCELGYMCILRNSTPTCVPDPAVDCGLVPAPENGSVDQSEGTSYGKTLDYSCDPGYDLLGERTRLCQTNGLWSSEAPVCSPSDCGDPEVPLHGNIFNVGGSTFSNTVTYRCNEGYSMNGHSLATCLDSGSWSSPPPLCIPTDCGTIQSPLHGIISIDVGTLGVTASYTCMDGYSLIGTRTRVCQRGSNSWTGESPVCVIKDCGFLSNPVGGTVNLSDGTTYGSVATYSCNIVGHTVSGDRTRLCGVSGTWSGSDPVCVPGECRPLSSPVGGTFAMSDGIQIGSTATLSCNPGFQRSGPSSITCGLNGLWSDTPPTCVLVVSCPVLNDPIYGTVTVTGNYQGAMATYTCHRGYRIVGTSTRTCLSTQSWSPEEPVCVLKDCGPVSAPQQGFVTVSGTTYGNTATFTCLPGYGLVGMATILCLDTGIWSDSMPSCVLSCPSLDVPRHGKISLVTHKLNEMATATFTCDLGYDLVGQDQRFCDGVVWSGTSPVCIAKDCGPVKNITNGSIGSYNSTSYGQTVTYFCNAGYALQGTSTVVCLGNSTWSQTPTCVLIDCGSPAEPEGGVIVVLSGTLYGQSAMYTCNQDYVSRGPFTITCLETGLWSQEPVCEKIDCGMLPELTNGNIHLTNGTTYNSRVTYSCYHGYQLIGSDSRICSLDGWSGIAPVCALVDCGQPKTIDNGHVLITKGTMYEAVVTYDCYYGYALVGVKTRTCVASGEWSDETPSCMYFDCGPLDSPEHGHVNTSAGTSYGHVAVYSCNQGYHVVGDSRRQCQSPGTWSGAQPSCRLHDCGPLKKPEDGDVAYSQTTFGAMATYKCDAMYTIVGSVTRTCDKTGKWTGSQPRCDSERGFALALGLGLGVGGFLLLVISVILVIVFLYRRRYMKEIRKTRRKTPYYIPDFPLPAEIMYSPMYLGQEMYTVYPPKYAPPNSSEMSRPASRQDKTSAQPRPATSNDEDSSRFPRERPGTTQDGRISAQSHTVYSGKLAPSHTSRDEGYMFYPPRDSRRSNSSQELNIAPVERIGRQDYLVPYSRQTTPTI